MNPAELEDLHKRRSAIIAAAEREVNMIRILREQLHIDSTLRRLDDLERRVAFLDGRDVDAPLPAAIPRKPTIIIGAFR